MNNLNVTIQNISDTIDKKEIQSLCKKILKKCSFKSAKDLENLSALALWLYVYGYCDETITVCDLISDVEFNGNYTLWDHIDVMLCIKARILRERKDKSAAKTIITFVNQYRHPELYKNTLDWFNNTLDTNIKNAIEQFHSKSQEISWRLVKLECAIKYREAGKYPMFDMKLDKIIKEQIAVLSLEK